MLNMTQTFFLYIMHLDTAVLYKTLPELIMIISLTHMHCSPSLSPYSSYWSSGCPLGTLGSLISRASTLILPPGLFLVSFSCYCLSQSRSFNFSEAQLINYFLHGLGLCCLKGPLYLKAFFHTQGHLGFFLCETLIMSLSSLLIFSP